MRTDAIDIQTLISGERIKNGNATKGFPTANKDTHRYGTVALPECNKTAIIRLGQRYKWRQEATQTRSTAAIDDCLDVHVDTHQRCPRWMAYDDDDKNQHDYCCFLCEGGWRSSALKDCCA